MKSLNQHIENLQSREPSVRNKAAIALMDAGDPIAIKYLIEAIEHPENREARGTLIYALSGFDCGGRFSQLFGWACEGGFEATCEALSIIRDQDLKPNHAELVVCESRLLELSSNSRGAELVDELKELIYGTPR